MISGVSEGRREDGGEKSKRTTSEWDPSSKLFDRAVGIASRRSDPSIKLEKKSALRKCGAKAP